MARVRELSKPHLVRDLCIIAASVACAIYIAQHDLIITLLRGEGFIPLEAFIAGIFFTSLLTVAPAGVAFAEMASFAQPLQLALWGACGALLGDLLLYFFVRDALSRDVLALLRGPWLRKLKTLFRGPFLSWAVPLMGALVIASPLPDEVGLAMLGLAKTDLRFLIPISFTMNFLGILLIAFSVQVLW